MEVVGATLDAMGKILVAYAAIRVHHRFWKEHKVDESVFRAMKIEQVAGIVGVALIVAGFFLLLPSKL